MYTLNFKLELDNYFRPIVCTGPLGNEAAKCHKVLLRTRKTGTTSRSSTSCTLDHKSTGTSLGACSIVWNKHVDPHHACICKYRETCSLTTMPKEYGWAGNVAIWDWHSGTTFNVQILDPNHFFVGRIPIFFMSILYPRSACGALPDHDDECED